MTANNNALVPSERIEWRIHLTRGYKVMVNADLAQPYDVETRALVQVIKRNMKSFPDNFIFKLTVEEVEEINRSQFAAGS